ncbi:restriction endonuclease subunit S [Actinotignum urinale]|uniref:Restriction endonuclease subunit S n=1 Tax=Actinotignum urinale TaxID=190146 RepID=A0ABU5G9G0_9ACTO|nr:restriction endonuclease subunit S [Actinotignum urinale]MDY5129869.1 restriction endonuclease subunit S [Actinotignum urinale]MDY5133832.1 restriction endonuclease subunit S [Actinotignum urinale]
MEKLSEKEWKAVPIDDLADVDSGRDIYAQDRIKGETPYVTAGTANNGIGYFVGNENDSLAANAISVNRNGAVGEAFYHPYLALYGNDCRRLSLREDRRAGTQIFVARAVSKQKGAFSYSRKLGTARLKRLHVMLPVDDKGKPDYAYMTLYSTEVRGGDAHAV